MNFRVELDVYRGPLDLLLYLVRKHEVDVAEVPLAAVADQFLAHLEVLSELNINDVGDFVEMASTLIEIKSRMVLPRAGEEAEEIDEAREELVQRLLEYKKFKDAASMLEERGRRWQQRYARLADDLPPRKLDPAEQPIHEVEMWDLVSAFGRMMREQAAMTPPTIVYDDTPIQVYMTRIHERLVASRRTCFSEMFQPGMHKSAMIGVFLAILELVRHHRIHAEQDDVHGEIWVTPGETFEEGLEIADVDGYGE
ncbi:MAG: segregation/condensation protein A [Planctomycetes bacterium]|nr:segregation/condensation protein A [Planctomycetota bacterium]